MCDFYKACLKKVCFQASFFVVNSKLWVWRIVYIFTISLIKLWYNDEKEY